VNETVPYALISVSFHDREMVKVSPPPVRAAENGAYKPAALSDRDVAESGIAFQKGSDVFPGISFAEADSLGPRPKGVCLLMILEAKLP
jgi:hypothetical protein